MDVRHAAQLALACLDLTSLNDGDTEADIQRLCARAPGPAGSVAAVCVWPRLASIARRQLPPAIAVAAVANFPDGGDDLERALRDTGQIVDAGAQEVDVVLPYRTLMAGEATPCAALLQAVRRACTGLRLKVIIESGTLAQETLIVQATRIALDAGADFVKTSTGKSAAGATPQAAQAILRTIAADARSGAGFKVAGGVRSVADAQLYLALVSQHLGSAALTPARFRIGASGLLAELEAVLGGAVAPQTGTSAY